MATSESWSMDMHHRNEWNWKSAILIFIGHLSSIITHKLDGEWLVFYALHPLDQLPHSLRGVLPLVPEPISIVHCPPPGRAVHYVPHRLDGLPRNGPHQEGPQFTAVGGGDDKGVAEPRQEGQPFIWMVRKDQMLSNFNDTSWKWSAQSLRPRFLQGTIRTWTRPSCPAWTGSSACGRCARVPWRLQTGQMGQEGAWQRPKPRPGSEKAARE